MKFQQIHDFNLKFLLQTKAVLISSLNLSINYWSLNKT